jgi:hypothetical protein
MQVRYINTCCCCCLLLFFFIALNFKCLVVSQETYKSGLQINLKRDENHLSQLSIHQVDLIEETSDPERIGDGDEAKISSSNERRRILGTLLRPPIVREETANGISFSRLISLGYRDKNR